LFAADKTGDHAKGLEMLGEFRRWLFSAESGPSTTPPLTGSANLLQAALRPSKERHRPYGFQGTEFRGPRSSRAEFQESIVEKFKAQPGPNDPEVLKKAAERQAQAAARAEAQKLRDAAKAEKLAREAELAAQAAAEALRVQAEKEAAEAALKAQQKAARDARYAARKAK
jgi:dihydroorotase-like cyclic amidohydrolase